MSNAEVWRKWEGRTVDGKFPLRQWLGGSDHSAVFLTERSGPSERAAIKLIAADGAEADRQLSRWQAAAQLSHPHLIRIFETGRCQLNGTPLLFVVMECAEEDLSQILPQRALTPGEVTDMLPPLLDALAYLHGKGFVHGRIKPSNVLAVGDQLKLSTDQIAPSAKASSEHASPTPASTEQRRRDVYDAPETAAGVVSPASDIWSVGATLVAALIQGTRLSGEPSQADPSLPETMPEPFRGIARECLHFDPRRRCSIAEIMARLQPAARSVPAPSEAPPLPPRRMNRKVVIGAALAAALLIPLIIVFSHGKGGTPQAETPSQPAATSAAPGATMSQPAPQTAPKPAPEAPAQRTAPAPTKQPVHSGDIVHQVIPDVPRSARNTITGRIRVVVRVDVDPSGKVTSARLTSPGPSKYFANLALKAAEHWEFSPQEAAGPASRTWAITFRFGRASTQASPERLKR